MRTYLHINPSDRTIKKEQMEGEQLARAGRYHIVKTMLDRGLADCDPLGPDNPLIFSAGPFARSNFSNANRNALSRSCVPIEHRSGGGQDTSRCFRSGMLPSWRINTVRSW